MARERNREAERRRDTEALAVSVPIFLLLFAGTYYLTSVYAPGSFNQENLTRTDTLYFAVTIFSTVGFGDITATSQSARLVVTSQMILDLIILGVGINALLHAAKVDRARQSTAKESDPEMKDPHEGGERLIHAYCMTTAHHDPDMLG